MQQLCHYFKVGVSNLANILLLSRWSRGLIRQTFFMATLYVYTYTIFCGKITCSHSTPTCASLSTTLFPPRWPCLPSETWNSTSISRRICGWIEFGVYASWGECTRQSICCERLSKLFANCPRLTCSVDAAPLSEYGDNSAVPMWIEKRKMARQRCRVVSW